MKEKESLSELVQVRVTRSMKDALHTKARELHLRPADIFRFAFAQMIANGICPKQNNTND